jgi:hypothetical protein
MARSRFPTEIETETWQITSRNSKRITSTAKKTKDYLLNSSHPRMGVIDWIRRLPQMRGVTSPI